MNLKTLVQKLVPYSSAVYADHVFREMGRDGNQKAAIEEINKQVPILIEAATKLRDLVKSMEEASTDLKGFIIYREESEEEKRRKEEEEAKLKELIKQNQGETELQETSTPEEEDLGVNEQTAAIIKKFKGKILKEFIPHFMLHQFENEPYIEYESFDICVDEYFSQA